MKNESPKSTRSISIEWDRDESIETELIKYILKISKYCSVGYNTNLIRLRHSEITC